MSEEKEVLSARNMLRRYQADIKDGKREISNFEYLGDWLQDLAVAEGGNPGKMGFRDFLAKDFVDSMQAAGINSGKVCEIGGPNNSFGNDMPDYDFEYLSLYPDAKFDSVLVADATQCDHLKGERYDAIFSVSVFEHISKPWKAAEHLCRLLKPGGIMYHAAPFSYFYHGAPADFWRFTPDAMNLMFSSLKPIKSEFYAENRRRDNRGSDFNPVDRDGGPAFSVDAFGGWRENMYTIYCGQKDAEYEDVLKDRNVAQVLINLVKALTLEGVSEKMAIDRVHKKSKNFRVSQDAEIQMVKKGEGLKVSKKDITTLWKTRGRNGIRPNYARFVMAKIVGW